MGGRPYSCRPRTLLRDYRGVQGCPSLPAAGSALRAERVRCMCSSTAQVRARPCATGSGDDLTAVAPVLCCATTEVCKAVLPSRFGRRVREGSSHCRVSPPRVGGDTCFSLYRGGVRAANGPLDSHLRWALFLLSAHLLHRRITPDTGRGRRFLRGPVGCGCFHFPDSLLGWPSFSRRPVCVLHFSSRAPKVRVRGHMRFAAQQTMLWRALRAARPSPRCAQPHLLSTLGDRGPSLPWRK